jgi:hypothetical protein
MIPYNVRFPAALSNAKKWQTEALEWAKLNYAASNNDGFKPLTAKALYITGIILDYCHCVTILLDEEHFISTAFYPAYATFASAVELLGRCINGNRTKKNAGNDLTTGFKWLAAPAANKYQSISDNHILVHTGNAYPIKELVALRNFSAHGQGVNPSTFKRFDHFILEKMPALIGNAMEAYLTELKSSDDLANNLGKALVTPYRSQPISDVSWGFHHQNDPAKLATLIGDAICKMDWSSKEVIKIQKRLATANPLGFLGF